MNMKQHILTGLREERDEWDELLKQLDEAQMDAPLLPSDWSIKDEMAHLWAWQQRSIARCEAALRDRAPEFPRWEAGVDPEVEESTDQVNGWIYQAYRDQPWSEVYHQWRDGFQRLLALAEQVSERDLLDSGRYPWLNGYPLALVLLGTYDHHQEHFDKLQAWLREHPASG